LIVVVPNRNIALGFNHGLGVVARAEQHERQGAAAAHHEEGQKADAAQTDQQGHFAAGRCGCRVVFAKDRAARGHRRLGRGGSRLRPDGFNRFVHHLHDVYGLGGGNADDFIAIAAADAFAADVVIHHERGFA
jgi:hypothetical protein